jgi:hypothetical protein
VKLVAACLAGVLVSVGGAARAHVGATITPAKFTTPPGPAVTRGSPINGVAPFTFASASASSSYVVSWEDGDTDPTGRYTFYYVDHNLPYQVTVDAIEQGLATRVHTADGINENGGYWISCSCTATSTIVCPDAGARDPAGNCANQLTWDLSQVPDGSYWLVAVNHDPPLPSIFSISDGPVRVAKSPSQLPPAVVVIRPDGYGSFAQYRSQWIATGTPPLRFDLFYFDGRDSDPSIVLRPPLPLAAKVSPIFNSDGSFSYDWDFAQLMSGAYEYLRVKVTDGNGLSSFSDSHFAVRVYRDAPLPDLGAPVSPDMGGGVPPKKHSGCSFSQAEPTVLAVPFALTLLVAATGLRAARRRRHSKAAQSGSRAPGDRA